MANQLDPHHLVALMCYEFRSGQDGSARRLDPRSDLTSGIVGRYGTNVRTRPVMDALAHISVSHPYSQVVAIALQLKPGTKEIRLTIAENQDVGDSLVNHLYNIWGKLQALSDEYAGQRAEAWDGNQRTEELDEDPMLSPEIPLEVGQPLKIEIFRDVYHYCLEKQMKRVKKHRTGVGLGGFEQNLSEAVVALVLALELVFKLPEKQLTDGEWEEVYWQSMTANEEAKLVLADSHGLGCENLARELKGDLPGDPFQLQRALEKLISLPHHIESLFGFAHSPRLRSALQYHMTICAVLGQAQIVKLPTSREKWKSFLEDACDEHNRWQGKDAVKLFQKFGLWERECPVHCECGLIQYLQTKHCDSWDNVPAFSYIGVSKLSCSACRVWIEAFNELGGPKFYSRGSHGKWYWPWGMPMAEGPLKEKMTEKVLDEYITQLEEKGKIKKRAGSDGSGAIPSGAEHKISITRSQSAKARGDAAVQESGGDLRGFLKARVPRLVG
ncbi:hypothetical protein L873DRAFT_1794729 [Choiromyces venosus 120613-1]|uniref:Uncharacterized protein n=1 Tax=Choiromyces venosus 120613-1 TaxID=1336337 RepID=A0A3N4J4Z9_9PEZI|nr:hypothetical protein L873DRAFT_1794729 [Choiromyces venosus 120613-1]